MQVLTSSESFWLRLADLGICGVTLLALLLILYWGLRDLRGELRVLSSSIRQLPDSFRASPSMEERRER